MMLNFPDRLNELIESKKRTSLQEDLSLAKIATDIKDTTGYSISVGYLSELRNGVKTDPKMGLIDALAKYFDVSPGYFFMNEIEAAQANLSNTLNKIGATNLKFREEDINADSIKIIAKIFDTIQELNNLNS